MGLGGEEGAGLGFLVTAFLFKGKGANVQVKETHLLFAYSLFWFCIYFMSQYNREGQPICTLTIPTFSTHCKPCQLSPGHGKSKTFPLDKAPDITYKEITK